MKDLYSLGIPRHVRVVLLIAVFASLFAPGRLEAEDVTRPAQLAAAVLAPTGQPQDLSVAARDPERTGQVTAAFAALLAVVVTLAPPPLAWRAVRSESRIQVLHVGTVGLRRRGPPPLLV